MASSLNHPHILTVFEGGEFEGRQYLVTEFIDGGTLRDWTRANAAHQPDWQTLRTEAESFRNLASRPGPAIK